MLRLALGLSVGAGLDNPDLLSLDLNFAADKSYSKPTTVAAGETVINARTGPSPVFLRSSMGTMVGSDGLIQYAPENLVTKSNNFTGVWGSYAFAMATPSSAIGPNGEISTWDFSFPANSLAQYYQLVTTVDTIYTASVWAKVTSGTQKIRLKYNNGTIDTFSPDFTVTTTWTRFSYTFTGSNASSNIAICNASDGVARVVSIFGVQLERSSTARQYIPTTTAVVYGPRFDHEPVGRTNFIAYSNDILQWAQAVNITRAATSVAGPNGESVGSIIFNNSSDARLGANSSTSHASKTFTGSVYLKAASATAATIRLSSNGVRYTGTSNINITTAWVRYSVTATGLVTDIGAVNFDLSVNGVTGIEIFVANAQVEEGSVATEYITTTNNAPLTVRICKGLLIEEQSANIAFYSKAIVSGTGWALTEVTSTSVSTPVSPDGSSPYEIAETGNNTGHAAANTGGSGSTGATSVTSGIAYTGSIFLRKITGSVDWIQLAMSGLGFGATPYANFNLSSGTTGNYAGLTAGTLPQIVSCGNGWYRCSITVTATATTTTSGNIIVAFVNNTNGTQRIPSYLGNTANKVLANMCQFEAKAFPTSYIPTTTGSATRSADLCSITGTNFTRFYNQAAGTVIANIYSCPSVNGNRFNSFGVQRTLEFYAIGNSIVYFDGGGSGIIIKSSATYPCNVAVACTLNDSVGIFNGVIGATNSLLTMASPTFLYIGAYYTGSNQLNGCIKSFKYYKKRIPNAKLQSMTAP